MIQIGNCATLEQGIKDLQHFRAYKPFQYGGTWFVGVINGETFAYRTKAALIKRAAEAGLTALDIAIVKPAR